MADVISTVNSVRARRGREQINPYVIAEGPEGPPPLPHDFSDEGMAEVEKAFPPGWLDDAQPPPTKQELSALPKSPLIALLEQDEKIVRDQETVPVADLMVTGKAASYKGQWVTLNDREEAAVARIVVEALAARIREVLQGLTKAAPRRSRKPKVEAQIPERFHVEPPAEPVKRKRGRPRKVQQGQPA